MTTRGSDFMPGEGELETATPAHMAVRTPVSAEVPKRGWAGHPAAEAAARRRQAIDRFLAVVGAAGRIS